jgi:hypothetical protein
MRSFHTSCKWSVHICCYLLLFKGTRFYYVLAHCWPTIWTPMNSTAFPNISIHTCIHTYVYRLKNCILCTENMKWSREGKVMSACLNVLSHVLFNQILMKFGTGSQHLKFPHKFCSGLVQCDPYFTILSSHILSHSSKMAQRTKKFIMDVFRSANFIWNISLYEKIVSFSIISLLLIIFVNTKIWLHEL